MSSGLEVRVHVRDHEPEAVIALLKDLVHETELVPLEVVKHPFATGAFLGNDGFRLVGDHDFPHNLEHQGLRRWLEPEVGIFFFLGEGLLCFLEVSEAVELLDSDIRHICEPLLRLREEWLLKVWSVALVKILLSLPDEVVASFHGLDLLSICLARG